jgi:predicted XRE-type DNA-binding protein
MRSPGALTPSTRPGDRRPGRGRNGEQNVFRDLGFPAGEARVLLMRARLAEALRQWIETSALTQTAAAARLGISQSRVSEIVRGRVELLSLDYLAGLCARAGMQVDVRLAA